MRPLGEKSTSRNLNQLKLRLACSAMGWPIIPCEAKAFLPKGWVKMANDAAAIAAWDDPRGGHKAFAGTGVRIEGDMLVIDLDIDTQAVMDAMVRALRRDFPEIKDGLIRSSGGVSLAIFMRVSEPVGYRRTAIYGDGEKVEVFGSKVTRYFAIHGPHSKQGREYSWLTKAPWECELSTLPVFDAARIGALVDCCDAVFARHLTRVPNTERPEDTASVVYDLEPGKTFTTTDGAEIELAALEKQMAPGDEVRGILDRKAWAASKRKNHCKAFIGPGGRMIVFDFQEYVSHRWVGGQPTAALDIDPEGMAKMRAAMEGAHGSDGDTAQEDTGEPPDGIARDADPEVTYANAVAWLLHNVAFYTQAFHGRGGAVSIEPDGEFQMPVTIAALRERMMGYSYTTEGERGGIKNHNPVDAWRMQPARICVSGIRMRPELARPLFLENGEPYINRYAPPAHPATGGSIDVFVRALERLVPDSDERAWVWNWIACLVQHPEWRMIALAMVARDNGSGRGLFAEALMMLLGRRFVVSLPYDSVSGGSRFNAEVVDRLLVYVNEARGPESQKFYSKSAAREALKVFIEPNHRIPFRVEPKGVDAYYTLAAISTLLLTNSIDALPINEEDRRIAVVLNGPQMGVGERDALQAWMASAANIGALYRALRDHAIEQDRTVFDPYMAPHFHGRDLMIDAGKTMIDIAWERAIEKLRSAADLATMSQIVALARHYGEPKHTDFDDLVRKHTVLHGYRIGVRRSTNWLVRYGKGEDNQERVYAFDEAGRRAYTHADAYVIKAQLDKAQAVVGTPGKVFNKLIHEVTLET